MFNGPTTAKAIWRRGQGYMPLPLLRGIFSLDYCKLSQLLQNILEGSVVHIIYMDFFFNPFPPFVNANFDTSVVKRALQNYNILYMLMVIFCINMPYDNFKLKP